MSKYSSSFCWVRSSTSLSSTLTPDSSKGSLSVVEIGEDGKILLDNDASSKHFFAVLDSGGCRSFLFLLPAISFPKFLHASHTFLPSSKPKLQCRLRINILCSSFSVRKVEELIFNSSEICTPRHNFMFT